MKILIWDLVYEMIHCNWKTFVRILCRLFFFYCESKIVLELNIVTVIANNTCISYHSPILWKTKKQDDVLGYKRDKVA